MKTQLTKLMLAAMIAAGAVQALADGITVSEDTASTYKPTTIVNGSFESEPWMDFTLSGTNYTLQSKNSSLSIGTITACSPNDVDHGWNTTENQPYRGTLFEYSDDLPNYNSSIPNVDSANHFVEMNVNNSAVLYQDLTTHGNDVIRWSLKHAVRISYAANVQSMRVEIGAPEYSGENIVAAAGINDNINSHIQDATKAVYRADGITNPSGAAYGFEGTNLSKLSLNKTSSADNDTWHTVTGVYVVPAGQSVTRFGFIAEMKTADNPSCGNLLDDITFSTLIGNLSARQLENYDVELKGYWGETDTTKSLKVVVGTTTYDVDMTSVVGKNFKIVIPAATIGAATSVHVYHQDYEDAGRTIALMSVLDAWEMDFTGDIQTFTAPCSGIYQLRVWGAQGGNRTHSDNKFTPGGLGGYATCRTSLEEGETIYIYVGGQGGTVIDDNGRAAGAGGWNGGGAGGNGDGGHSGSAGGGGATHISKVNNQVIGSGSGQCASLAGTEYIIVAGGGGGAGHTVCGVGAGGGVEGGKGTRYTENKTTVEYSTTFYSSTSQSYGARGGHGINASTTAEGAGGGGGGYYGGTSNYPNDTFDSAYQDAGGCGGNSAYNSKFATEFSTIAGQREGNGKAQIVLLVSQDEIDAHVGKVIGADGKMYKTVTAATNAGTTASGVIAYWGWAGSVESGTNYRGMALSLENMYYSFTKSYGMKYCVSNSYETGCSGFSYCNSLSDALNTLNGIAATTGLCERNSSHDSGHEAAAVARAYAKARPAGASAWSIPSMGQWNLMAKALTGGSDISETDNPTYAHDNVSTKIAAVGGANLTWALYWSTTEKDATHAWTFDIGAISDAYSRNGGRANSIRKEYGGAEYVRAFFAFEDATDAVYTISYDANGGSGAPSAQAKDGGIDSTLSGVTPTRAGYVFKGWNTAANGTGTSYASGATFAGNADITLYAQWGGYGAWAEENSISGAMDDKDENGVPNVFRYVFDQPEGEVKVVSDVDVVGTSVKMSTPEIKKNEGFTVKYELDRVAASGEVLSAGTASTSADALGIDFESVKSNAYFKVAVVLESTDGTAAQTKVLSDTKIGVLAITNAPTTAIIGAPWVALSGGAISVSNLVYTANLTAGDTIKVYDATDKVYKMWELDEDAGGNKEWVPSTTTTTGGSSIADEASEATIPRGVGVWLTRQHPGTPIYLVGMPTDEDVTTPLDAPEASGSQTWNLVASPKVEPVDVAELLEGKKATDQVMVPTAGAPKNFLYLDGQWGYIDYESDGNGLVYPVFKTDTTIPAGTGFWYLNGDPGHNQLEWN